MKGIRACVTIFFLCISLTGCGSLEKADESNAKKNNGKTELQILEIENKYPIISMKVVKYDKDRKEYVEFSENADVTENLSEEGMEDISFYRKKDAIDTLAMSFWNVNNSNEITINVDGLQIQIPIVVFEPQEFQNRQQVELGDENAVITKIEKYPETIIVHLSDVSSGFFSDPSNFFFLQLKESEKKEIPPTILGEGKDAVMIYSLPDDCDIDQIEGIMNPHIKLDFSVSEPGD